MRVVSFDHVKVAHRFSPLYQKAYIAALSSDSPLPFILVLWFAWHPVTFTIRAPPPTPPRPPQLDSLTLSD